MMIDNVIPKEKWEFDENVTNCFDDMLSRSIPNYREMRSLTKLIVDKYKAKRPPYLPFKLLDLGCSNGINIELFAENDSIECYGIDISEPMITKAKEKFAENANVHIKRHDIRKGLTTLGNFHVITSVLTLQFVPMEYRQDILADIFESLSDNGMFLLVEKTLGSNALINGLLVDSYYAIKNQNGYSYDAIERKKKSLEGVLVPCTSEWNKDLLKQAGFTQIETFWKYLNFEGILAVKGSRFS